MDDRLRRMERAWKETGSVDAERAFRLAQLRAGELTEDDLAAMSVRQVLIQPTGKLGKGTDPRAVLEELTRLDPLLQLRVSHEQSLPLWRGKRRIPWQRALAAPSDGLLNEAVARFRSEIDRDLDISPPAPVFHRTLTGQLVHQEQHYPTQVTLTFRRRPDLAPFQVLAREHDPEVVESIRRGVADALSQAEPAWLPFGGFDVDFSIAQPTRYGREETWIAGDATTQAIQIPTHHQLLEPWVRVTVTGTKASHAIHALAKDGGWADGGEGTTHHGVIALRQLPRARKRIEKEGCALTWVYERHEVGNETRESVETLLRAFGWNLGRR